MFIAWRMGFVRVVQCKKAPYWAPGGHDDRAYHVYARDDSRHGLGYVHLRGDASTLWYVNMYYGSGINDAAGSERRYCKLMTNTYGLASVRPRASDVASCTVGYNDYGILLYADASPVISYCNILSSTVYDVQLQRAESVTVPDCWWGSDPPDDDKVWDDNADLTLGLLDRTSYATGWITW